MSSNGVTAAGDWGKAPDKPTELPSGNKAVLKPKLNVWMLVRRGVMSHEMLAAFNDAAKGQLEDLDMAVALNDVVLAEMFIDPPVFVPGDTEDEQPEGHVHVDDIDDADVAFVLEQAFRGAHEAAAFRGDSGGPDGGGDSEDVGGPPKSATGSRGRRGGRVPAGQAARGTTRSRAANQRTKS